MVVQGDYESRQVCTPESKREGDETGPSSRDMLLEPSMKQAPPQGQWDKIDEHQHDASDQKWIFGELFSPYGVNGHHHWFRDGSKHQRQQWWFARIAVFLAISTTMANHIDGIP